MTTENPIIKSLSKVRFYHQDSRNIACHYMSIPLILVGLSFPFVLLDNVISTVFPNVSEGTVAYTIPFLYIMYFASWDLWVSLASGSLVFATMFTCVTLASMQYGLVYIATCAILGTLFSLVGHSIYELRTPANDLPEFPVTVFYFALLLFFPFGYREELRDKIWKEADSHLLNFLTKDYPKKSKRILNGSGIVYYEEMKWSNWASNISLNAQMRFFPTTIEDLTTIVKLANQNNKKISLIGSGHSWSPVSTTEDYLIDIRLLRDIKVNKENCLVKIQPGVSVAELDTVLAKHGLCLPTNVILTSVKYGGIIGTGCHGAGSTIPPMGDMVISMDMINHEGQIVTIDESNPELLNAARVNLGTMGIMCSITMKVLPMYNLRMIDSRLKVEDLSDTKILRKVNEEHQMYELFWFPFSKSVWLKTWDKTKDDVTLTNTQKTILDFTQFFETYFGIIFYKLITSQLLYTKTPFIVPMITRTLGKYSNMVGQCPDMVHYRRFIENGLCYNTEFAIPVDKDYENVLKAWQAIQRVIEKYQSQNLFPINLCIEMRSTKNSTAYLSPCVGEEGSHFAYVEIISYQNTKGYCDAAKDISEELMKIGARPHWAKMYQVVPEKEMNPYLRNVYGDNFNKFKKIRDQFDPKKMFVSNYMEDLFFGGDQQ